MVEHSADIVLKKFGEGCTVGDVMAVCYSEDERIFCWALQALTFYKLFSYYTMFTVQLVVTQFINTI